MPIPGLSVKTHSPQNWRKGTSRGYKVRTSFSKKPIYVGKGGRKKSSFGKKLFKILLSLTILGIIFGSIFALGALAWYSKDLPDPNKIIERDVALSTKIYDRTGETVLYDIHGAEQRTMVELDDIPDYMLWATLAAEDKKFYEHKGFKLTSIIRAALVDIIKGGKVQGASTLTQQLVKNVILSPEKTYTRKIKELVLSYQIEKKFSKDEILKMYFNEIPYGSTAYGVEAAAQTYFSKSAEDLTLAEATILAALTKAPSYYSPYGSHQDELFGRQGYILDVMAQEGYITKEQATQAKEEKIEFKERTESIIAPHFVMFVKEYLSQKYGERTVEQGGLQVITTLDLYKQEIAEEVVKKWAEENTRSWGATNAALVALDPKTGQILSMVGSKDFFDEEIDGQVNVTTRPRQPGSSFKPIVYAAAFRQGYTPKTVLYDVETTFKTEIKKDYEPKNYDLEERGPITIRQALAGSINIPAVKTIYLTGIDNVLDLADSFGYTTLKDRSRFGLSLVLGGGEVKLLEHTNTYATFAREGEWHQISSILEVKDKDGKKLEEFKKKEMKILETQIARQINNILSDNSARAFAFGINNYLNLGERPVGAKTGTTNDYRDAWTLGYTPSLAVGVWVGNNDNTPMKKGAAGAVVAAPIWHEFMTKVLGDTPVEYFKEPEPVKTGKPVLDGVVSGEVTLRIDKASGKLATEFTPPSYIQEKTFKQAHNILHYINKNDPQGAPPEDPTLDPQYENWEAAVQKWAEEQGFVAENPPTEYDDVHLPQNKPNISITSPSNNSTITSRTISATVDVSAPRGVSRVEYYLDNKLIYTAKTSSFNLSAYLGDPNLGNGFYTLKTIAYDDVDNSNFDQIEVNLLLPPSEISLSWTSPQNNSTYLISEFPLDISGTFTGADKVEKLNLYYKNTTTGSTGFIGTIRQFPDNKIIGLWQPAPEAGHYEIYAEVTLVGGGSFTSEKVLAKIE